MRPVTLKRQATAPRSSESSESLTEGGRCFVDPIFAGDFPGGRSHWPDGTHGDGRGDARRRPRREGRAVSGRGPVVGRGRAGRRAPGGDAGSAGRRLAAAHGRGLRRGAGRARHLPRGGTRATGEAHPVRLRRRRSPAPAALGATVGRARAPRLGPGTSTSPGVRCRPRPGTCRGFSACRPPTGRSGSRPSPASPTPSRPRSPRSPRSTPAWCRRWWPARPAACCWRTSRRGLLGRVPAGRGRRVGIAWSPRRPASARGRPPSPTAARGLLAAAVRDLLDGPVGAELSPPELRAARSLQPRWEMLADCGLPDTVVHGDFHPGNWRRGAGPPVVLDFADAHWGNPVLDGLRAIDFLPASGAARRPMPGSRPGPPRRPARVRPRRCGSRTAGAPRVRRPLPGVPRQHRTERTRLSPRRSGRIDPPGACLRQQRG